MNGKWVTLKTYENMAEAHLAKSILERHDIPCLLEDVQTGSLMYPPEIGIKLLVAPGNLDRATALLNPDMIVS